jgi:fused signal recognition particle receptor
VSDVLDSDKKKGGWLSRLRDGLAKSTKRVTESITGLFTKKKLDQETLNELEDALIQADLGVAVATAWSRSSAASASARKSPTRRCGPPSPTTSPRSCSRSRPRSASIPRASRMSCWWWRQRQRQDHHHRQARPSVQGEGKKVMLAAGDTFRAAAVEQLKVWGERAGVPVIAKGPGADAAGLATRRSRRPAPSAATCC